MKCPNCGHNNLTHFPFCEQCLSVLPTEDTQEKGPLFHQDLMVTGDDEAETSSVAWPAFPWNPRKMKDPMIGRDYAIHELDAGWEDVLKHWRARIHLLLAEAGMGKSRLASVFVNRALERERDTWIIRCQCPRYGSTYRLWDVILRTAFGIRAAADDVEAGEGLLDAVRRYVPEEASEVASLVAYLTRWEVPGQHKTQLQADHDALVSRATGALARLLAAMCMERPLLVIVDNADRASESLVVAGALEATLKHRPFMLLLTGSMDFINILPGWNRFPATQLGALLPEDSRAMLKLFLSGLGDPPIEFVDQVVEKSGGSPQAIKAIVRYIRESGYISARKSGYVLEKKKLAGLELPDDLESLVLARVTKLPAEEKNVLAHAGVVGKVFWLGALVAIQRRDEDDVLKPGSLVRDQRPERIRKVLKELVKRRFIEPRPSDIQGEESYAFRSDLHWEAATNLLPIVKQRRFHQVVEQWLLMNVTADPDPYLEEFATHAENGGHEERAAAYLLQAAKVARSRKSPVDERRHLLSARALVSGEDSQTYYKVHFDLGGAMQRVGDLDLSLECFQSALQMAWRMRNRALGARSLARIGEVESERGEYESAYSHIHRALQLYEAVGEHLGIAETCNRLGRMYWLRGEFDNALRAYERAESIYESQRHDAGRAATVHAVAAIYAERGDLALAEQRYKHALELRRGGKDNNSIAATLNDLGCIWMMQGRPEDSIALWEEGCQLAEEVGERATEATIRDSLGEGLIALGRLDEASEQLTKSVKLAEAVGALRVLSHSYLNLSRISLARNDWEGADSALGEASTHADLLGLPRLKGLVDRIRGDLTFARLELPKARNMKKAKAAKSPRKGKDTAGKSPQSKKKPPTKAQVKEVMAGVEQAYRKAIDAFEGTGYDGDAALAHERLAEAFDHVGMKAKAKKERKAAKGLRQLHVSQ